MKFIIQKVIPVIITLALASCTKCSSPKEETATKNEQGPVEIYKETDELVITDRQKGSGSEAVNGKSVSLHYTGRFIDGKKFDSSRDRDLPFTFTLGAGQVIKGWDKGVVGMRVGGKRHLLIPPELGYGKRGAGGIIPPDATLSFEVELLDVK